MTLSPHFTLDELTRTSVAAPNVPGMAEVVALVYLCDRVLEPVRSLLGVPLRVSSGYRSEEVNRRVGGSPRSQHMRGEAADVVPVGIDIAQAMADLADAVRGSGLQVDQAIVYPHARTPFLHLSYRLAGPNRGELLMSAAPGGHGGPFTPWP